MDRQTQDELRRIQMSVPASLGRRLMKDEVDTDMEDVVKDYLQNNRVPYEQQKRLEHLVDIGAFRSGEKVVDEKIAREIERYYDYKITKSRREGKLADPSKDAFFRKRLAKMSKGS